jgi:hypothetical protein
MNPAAAAPKKAPPVKTETTAPVSWSFGWNLRMKAFDEMTCAMTPKSYPYKREPRDAKSPTRN